MANYTANFRSNYFAVKNVAQFQAFCTAFQLEMITGLENNQTLYGFLNGGNESGLPATRYNDVIDDWEEVDFMNELATHLLDGHVAIVMEVGYEKLRYLIGVAQAVNAAGEMMEVDLEEIYMRAAALGLHRTSCTY
ncbi:MAG: hypothetical protein U0Y68_24430 [Blastocatellia bacterium]